MIARTAACGYETELSGWLGHMQSAISGMAQSAQQRPLLVYFHTPDDDRALPLAIEDLLELLTICRALLDPASFPRLATGHIPLTAYRTTVAFTVERAHSLGGATPPNRQAGAGFEETYRRLDARGVPLRERGPARDEYLRVRAEWEDMVSDMVAHFGYQTRRPA